MKKKCVAKMNFEKSDAIVYTLLRQLKAFIKLKLKKCTVYSKLFNLIW